MVNAKSRFRFRVWFRVNVRAGANSRIRVVLGLG